MEKLKTNKKVEKLQLPDEVVNAGWENINFETYGTNKQEMEYVPPEKVSEESIERIKEREQKLKRGSMLRLVFSRGNKNKLAA
ncbi:hypothetical protein J5491_00515 [Candidatus Saccharibacteria bacterium]|nr:hypothetical protein [Candidatus Saccharibacteria bacterium]